jgi:hypothetical protein
VGLDGVTREGVLRALAEFDAIGGEQFLLVHGVRPARRYKIDFEGRRYDSQAIVGVAHAYDYPELGQLEAADFSEGQVTVLSLLERLGFRVVFESGPLPVVDNDGRQLQATFEVSGSEREWEILFHSRGGTRDTPAARNSDYQDGLELLLLRLAQLNSVIVDAAADTRETRSLSPLERRLSLNYPVRLAADIEPRRLRLQIGRAAAAINRREGARGPGNQTKTISVSVETVRGFTGDEIAQTLQRGSEWLDATESDDLVAWLALIAQTPRARVGDTYSAHQPSTILWFASRARAGQPRLVSWLEARQPLGYVLEAAGGAPNPEYPLIALARSGVLEQVGLPEPLPVAHGGVASDLTRLNPMFGLAESIETQLRERPASLQRVAAAMAPEFSDDRQFRLVSAVCGLDIAFGEEQTQAPAGRREPARILRTVFGVHRTRSVADWVKSIYEDTCQRCGVRLHTPMGSVSEAAHIHAIGEGGPDIPGNVLCLCPNDHRTYDRCAWYLTENLRVRVVGESEDRPLARSIHPIDSDCVLAHLQVLRSHLGEFDQNTCV